MVAAFALVAGAGDLSSERVRAWVDEAGVWAPVAFVVVSASLTVAFFPGPLLAGASGLLFGTAVGFPLSLAAVVAASMVQMAISRHLAGGHHGALLPERTKSIEQFLTEHGAVAVMQSRIVPVLPWGVVNYSAGLTRLSYLSLAVGTLIGGAPKVFAYTALGGSLSNLGSPEAIVAIALLVVLALGGVLFVRRQIVTARA